MPASKALETSLACTCSGRFALSSSTNDDYICDKAEKKFDIREGVSSYAYRGVSRLYPALFCEPCPSNIPHASGEPSADRALVGRTNSRRSAPEKADVQLVRRISLPKKGSSYAPLSNNSRFLLCSCILVLSSSCKVCSRFKQREDCREMISELRTAAPGPVLMAQYPRLPIFVQRCTLKRWRTRVRS